MTRPLAPELAKIAREELNETPDRIQQDLIILRVWMRQQAHLRARCSDDFLIAFLRRSRYSLEETKQRIDKFYTYYTLFSEVLSNRRVTQRILDLNRLGVHYYLDRPKCDNHTALLVVRFGLYCPQTYHLREVLRYITMATEVVAMESDNAAVAGICQIIDMSGVTYERLQQMDHLLFKKWWMWVQDCSPLRIKETYMLRPPKEVARWITIMKALRLKNSNVLFCVMKSNEELTEYIPKECLPEEYGGENGHVNESVAYMEDLLKSYRDYFEEDDYYGTIEELRSGDIATYEAEFGANGSFRKLEVD